MHIGMCQFKTKQPTLLCGCIPTYKTTTKRCFVEIIAPKNTNTNTKKYHQIVIRPIKGQTTRSTVIVNTPPSHIFFVDGSAVQYTELTCVATDTSKDTTIVMHWYTTKDLVKCRRVFLSQNQYHNSKNQR